MKISFVCFVCCFMIVSCVLPELREIEFNGNQVSIVKSYELQLESEEIVITPGCLSVGGKENHRIDIVIFNPVFGEIEETKQSYGLEIARDIFGCVNNKSDYTNVKVTFYNEGFVKKKLYYTYSVDEINEPGVTGSENN